MAMVIIELGEIFKYVRLKQKKISVLKLARAITLEVVGLPIFIAICYFLAKFAARGKWCMLTLLLMQLLHCGTEQYDFDLLVIFDVF